MDQEVSLPMIKACNCFPSPSEMALKLELAIRPAFKQAPAPGPVKNLSIGPEDIILAA